MGEDIAAYLIGEFVDKRKYEVITTWVDSKFKGLTIAVQVRFLATKKKEKKDQDKVSISILKKCKNRQKFDICKTKNSIYCMQF
jgi:hypothetical protein